MANSKYKPPFGYGPKRQPDDDPDGDEAEPGDEEQQQPKNPYNSKTQPNEYNKWRREHGLVKGVVGYRGTSQEAMEGYGGGRESPPEPQQDRQEPMPEGGYLPNLPDSAQIIIKMADLKRMLQEAMIGGDE